MFATARRGNFIGSSVGTFDVDGSFYFTPPHPHLLPAASLSFPQRSPSLSSNSIDGFFGSRRHPKSNGESLQQESWEMIVNVVLPHLLFRAGPLLVVGVHDYEYFFYRSPFTLPVLERIPINFNCPLPNALSWFQGEALLSSKAELLWFSIFPSSRYH